MHLPLLRSQRLFHLVSNELTILSNPSLSASQMEPNNRNKHKLTYLRCLTSSSLSSGGKCAFVPLGITGHLAINLSQRLCQILAILLIQINRYPSSATYATNTAKSCTSTSQTPFPTPLQLLQPPTNCSATPVLTKHPCTVSDLVLRTASKSAAFTNAAFGPLETSNPSTVLADHAYTRRSPQAPETTPRIDAPMLNPMCANSCCNPSASVHSAYSPTLSSYVNCGDVVY